MNTPIILIVGQAGSGKDTVASFMTKNHGAVAIAQADPMKRLAKIIFDFNADQLWGPSESRNAFDPRYDYQVGRAPWEGNAWDKAYKALESGPVQDWLRELFDSSDVSQQYSALRSWFNTVMTATFWSKKQLSPRYVLQTLGTEWGRKQGRDLWSVYTIRKAMKLLGGGYRYDREQGLISDEKEIGPQRVVITDGRFRNEVVNVLAIGGDVVRIDAPAISSDGIELAGVKGHASEAEQKLLPFTFFTGSILNNKAHGLKVLEENVAHLIGAIDSPNSYKRVGYSLGAKT